MFAVGYTGTMAATIMTAESAVRDATSESLMAPDWGRVCDVVDLASLGSKQ